MMTPLSSTRQRPCQQFLRQLLPCFIFVMIGFILSIAVLGEILCKPYINSQRWSDQRMEEESTYGRMACTEDDLTTTTFHDIMISNTNNQKQKVSSIVDSIMYHGVAFMEDMLSHEDAHALRDYILQKNARTRINQASNGEYHRRFLLSGTEDDSVSKVLRSIASHSVFSKTVAGLLGHNPALVEFSAGVIVSSADEEEIKQQSQRRWRRDTWLEGSPSLFGRTFTNLYTLVIQLDTVGLGMRSTILCPGTHRCHNGTIACDKKNGLTIPSDRNRWTVGSGLIYNSAILHQSSEFLGDVGTVVLMLSFTSRPDYPLTLSKYSRRLPIGPSYYRHLRMDMHGFALSDMNDATASMTLVHGGGIVRSLGISKPKEADWGWTYTRIMGQYMADVQQGIASHEADIKGFVPSIFAILLNPNIVLLGVDFGKNWPIRSVFSYLNVVAASLGIIGVSFMTGHTAILKKHLLTPILLSLLTTCLFVGWILNLAWKCDLDDLVTSPFPNQQRMHFTEDYIEEATAIRRDYVLFGVRLGSEMLPVHTAGSHSRFLYYHPGNRELNLEMDDFAGLYLAYQALPVVFQDALVSWIVNHRTFAEETAFGDWIEIEPDEVRPLVENELFSRWWDPHRVTLPYAGNVHLRTGPCSRSTSKLCQIRSPLRKVLLFSSDDDDAKRSLPKQRSTCTHTYISVTSAVLSTSPTCTRVFPRFELEEDWSIPHEDKWSTQFGVNDTVDALFYKPGRYPWSQPQEDEEELFSHVGTRKWTVGTIQWVSPDYSVMAVSDGDGEVLILDKTQIRKKAEIQHIWSLKTPLHRTASSYAIY